MNPRITSFCPVCAEIRTFLKPKGYEYHFCVMCGHSAARNASKTRK